MKINKDIDAIIIGSGVSGLTVANLLAKINKKKVIVLEQHYELGGLTHSFSRGKFVWDVGVHYIGKLDKSQIARVIFDYVTDSQLKWNKLPYYYDKMVFPDFTFSVPSNLDEYVRRVIEKFPDEEKVIKKIFKDMRRIGPSIMYLFLKLHSSFLLRWLFKLITVFVKKFYFQTTAQYLDKLTDNIQLKSLLTARWGDYGLPPGESSFFIHSVIEGHYGDGAFYPEGGSDKIALTMEKQIEESGGSILLNRKVTEIILEGNKATGVRVKNLLNNQEEIYQAPIIVSSAGVINTYINLLPSIPKIQKIKRQLLNYKKGYSSFIVYLGLKESPKKFGFSGENYWIFDEYNYHNNQLFDQMVQGVPKQVFLAFPSMKKRDDKVHTAELVTLLPIHFFEKWEKAKWKNRDLDYYELKEKMTENLLHIVEKKYPGFIDNIDYIEVATPLTMKYFNNQPHGEIYGIPSIPAKYKLDFLKVNTPVKNLKLTGVDILSLGVMGGFMSGIAAVSKLLGPLGFVRIVINAFKYAGKGPDETKKIADYHSGLVSDKKDAVLLEKTKLSDSVYELVFDMKKSALIKNAQHVKIKIDDYEWRSYSVVRIDGKDLTFVIDVSPGGSGSEYIKNLQISDTAQLRMPMQNLYYPNNNHKKVFIATGIGVTPFLSILFDLIDKKFKEKVTLFFGCRHESDLFINKYLEIFKKNLNIDVNISVSRPRNTGTYHKGYVTEQVKKMDIQSENVDYFLCGNPNMIQEIFSYLKAKKAANVYW